MDVSEIDDFANVHLSHCIENFARNFRSNKVNLPYIHNKIGSICSFSNANSIVGTKYLKSATIERGFVIGLSCLKGIKK